MTKKWGGLAASMLALVLVASTFDAAEARRNGSGIRSGGGHSFGARSFSGRSFAPYRSLGRSHIAGGGHVRHGHRHRHHHRHIGRGFAVGVPLAYGAYAYSYGSGCRWLRLRALETDSRYWWSRYYDCVNGYYD